MACFNRNTQEYKDLLRAFDTNMQVDGIITAWQNVNNTDSFPTVRQAEQFLKDKKIAFSLQQRNFSEAVLANLSRKKIISQLQGTYYVNNSTAVERAYNPTVLQSNVNKAKRYLDINNIPLDAVQFERTRKSVKVTVNENIFTPKDILDSSRSWDLNRTRHIVVHLMRMFPNVKIALASVSQAKEYYDSLPSWQKSKVPFSKVKSYFDPVANQVVLIEGRVTDQTAIEEMLHPFTDALYVDNKALFDSLLAEAKKMFPVLNQQIEDSYSDKRGFNQKHRDLELVTQALTRHFKKEYEENPTKTFLERVKEFIEWFAGIINNLHKYITGKDIPTFKRDIDYYQGDQALMEQEERFDEMEPAPTIKPGVQELFDSNPELANQVYEALGFNVWNNRNTVFDGNSFVSKKGNKFFIEKTTQDNNIKIKVVDKSGNFKGKATFSKNNDGSYSVTEDLVFVAEKNEGIGTAIYDFLSRNYKIKSQTNRTKEGELLWKNNITPQQKQQALQLYSQYLDTIFPGSQVKDIVYHASNIDFTKQSFKRDWIGNFKGVYFYFKNSGLFGKQSYKFDNPAIINIVKPETSYDKLQELISNNEKFAKTLWNLETNAAQSKTGKVYHGSYLMVESIDGTKSNIKYYERVNDNWIEINNETAENLIAKNSINGDGIVINNNQAVVFEPEQIHILGNKQDIEGFKDFVGKSDTSKTKPVVYKLDIKDINANAKLSDIARLLNTSDIQFDINSRADAKVRFSLTPELQSVVDYALRQSNAIQSEIIKRLFHQAITTKEEVGSLSAGDSGPIVVLNEENHVYYNVLDTTETFKSTTESIKGKLSEEDMFNKKLNIDLGNDFDNLLQGLASDKSADEVFSKMKILSKEQAEKAYLMLQENLNEITRGGGVAIPQVVVYDQASKRAGSIDILVVMPNGKLRIVDLKTSKNSVKDMALSEKAKAKSGLAGSLRYDKEYELGPTSDLKQAGINALSTRAQQGVQVNAYRRMLSNMGYEVDMDDMGASTFHIQVGIKGKDAKQEFTGEFRSDNWIMHPISQNELYVDLLIPKNKDILSAEEIEKNIGEAFNKDVVWDEELTDAEKMPEIGEVVDPYTEFQVITQALENYRVALTTKLKAMEQIKSAIYMDRTKEQTEENIFNALSAIAMAMAEGPKARAALYTELTRDALKQIKNFASYIKNPENFGKPEYITYVLNFNRFIKTFEGLYSVKTSKDLNATQRTLIAELQIQLNELGVSNSKKEGLINEAITNYVKEQIKNWSSRDDLTEDVLNDLMKHARDIPSWELNVNDIATSSDTILAVMDKIYKAKKQEVLDGIERRNRAIMGLASRLQKLSPNKNTQELYEFMLEFDEDGEFSGRYVQRLGRTYFKKQQELRDKLYDDNGNPLEYRDVSDPTTAKKEDLEFNIKLANARAEYAAFWAAERVGLDDKLKNGDFHSYTEDFKTERAKYQYYVPINGKAVWRRKAGVSDRAYQIFLAKYYNPVEYTYAHRDQNGNPTGAITRESIFYAVKPKYRVANDRNLRTGERLISEKYEKIMNPTDALGAAQKEFYLAFVQYYENELLSKIPMGHRAQMLGKVPVVKGKIFQDIKAKPNIVGKLWSKATRSVKNFVSETAEQRGIVLDEDGNLVDQLPIFYTGRARTDKELAAINAEIDSLNDRKRKGLITQDLYYREMPVLRGRLASLQSRPSKGEINKDMGTALLRFSAMAEHYEVMSSVEDTFKAFIKVLEQRTYQPADPGVTLGKWSKGKFIPKGRKEGLETNTVRRAKKWMAMVFYDNDQITKGFLEKVSDGLMEYSSLSYVAFNPFGNFNNYALGRINNSIEALGQRFFSGESYARAELEFNKRALPDLVNRLSSVAKKVGGKSDYDPELPSSKYEALVDLYRMMDEKAEIRETMQGPPPIKKSWFRKGADFGYILQDAAEYNVQTKVGIAMLMDTKIMNKATGDIISLYDAFEFDSETKGVKLKDGYDTIVTLDRKNVDADGNPKILKEQAYNDQFRYMLRNKIREVNKQIHGNYAKDDRMVIQSYAVGRLAAQFHKWVAPAIKARFRREYFDENLGWMEGRYRSFWKFLEFSFKKLATLQFEYGKHTEQFLEQYGYTGDGSQRDQRARDKLFGAYRTLGEIGIIMVTLALNQILASIFADDDDDTDFEKKMENFLRYQADRTYKELILFTPLGTGQIAQMVKSPIAATRTLGELGEALSLSVMSPIMYAIEGKEGFYADSDYVYQRGTRKGELKLYKNWADAAPILYSIKKYIDFSNLTNFYIK